MQEGYRGARSAEEREPRHFVEGSTCGTPWNFYTPHIHQLCAFCDKFIAVPLDSIITSLYPVNYYTQRVFCSTIPN